MIISRNTSSGEVLRYDILWFSKDRYEMKRMHERLMEERSTRKPWLEK